MAEPIDTSFASRYVVKVELSMDLPQLTMDCMPVGYGATVTISKWGGEPERAVRLENHVEASFHKGNCDPQGCHEEVRFLLLHDVLTALDDWLNKEFAAIAGEAALDKSR